MLVSRKGMANFMMGCVALVAGQSVYAFMPNGMKALDDSELSAVTGQALLVSDKILPNTLPGSDALTNFTFYRIGLDVKLEFNANIDQLKLGCGGVNDRVDSSVCDIDMDYVRFMGRDPLGGQTSPDGFFQRGSGKEAISYFTLLRPYLELAIKNDDSRTMREFAGIKIGAETADGYLGVGRLYAQGQTNLERGGTCNFGGNDAARAACHSGLNAVSGHLNATMSAYLRVTSGLGSAAACVGRPAGRAPCSGAGVSVDAYQVPVERSTGTRQTGLQVSDVPVENLHGASGLISLFSGSDLFLNLAEDLVYLHGFELPNTGDFFLSMQREQIRYPRVDKSGYAVAANTGWWMNVPRVALLDLEPPVVDLGCPGFLCLGLLSGFSAPGIKQTNVDLGSRPPNNCFGRTEFC